MKQKIFSAGNDWTGLILRLFIAIVLFPHGAQKLLGVFGGSGFAGNMDFFTNTVHLPWIVGFMVILIEFFGPFFLVVGLASRLWAITISILMVGILLTSHLPFGFFMNWFNNQGGEGYEFDLLMIGLSLALLFNGAGKYSIDRKISNKQ